jgi:glucans biosynthesis protein
LSRSGRGWSAKHRRFLVEFAGEIFGQAKADELKPNLSVSPGSIVFVRTFLSADQATYRVLFEIDPGGESFSELRLVIEAQGKPVSETWIYRWTP